MATETPHLEAIIRRDRVMIIAGIATVTLIAWAYLLYDARQMHHMAAMASASDMMLPQIAHWNAAEILALFLMWVVMMIAMMTPSVAPLVLMFARAHRQKGESRVVGSSALLLLGYLFVWTGLSAVATLLQWRLQSAALLSPMMVSTSSLLGGTLLVAAGVFQFTPLKHACLVHCRSPFSFLMAEWRPGQWGAFVMGAKHGIYCVGCCWILMALLFVAGVMNLFWVAAITVFILVEKLVPRGDLIGRYAGAALIVAGILLSVSYAH